jgi:hypothetical protein
MAATPPDKRNPAWRYAHPGSPQPDYRGTRWEDVQVDVCTALGMPHDAVETTIAEVLAALDAAGYTISR